jgi:superfamily I DNA and/or RNA helicase
MTIDRSQGTDKEIVILVIEKGAQQLVENPRRLNVALTRAKSKLIVVGSEDHLQNMKIWNGTLAKLFKPYQLELTKGMIQEMIKLVSQKL